MNISIFVYVFIFENSLGPVFWLYCSEFLIPSSFSIVAFINWLTIVVLGLTAPYMITWSVGNTFSIYGGLCIIGGLYSVIFLRETKGLSKDQVSKLYASELYDNSVMEMSHMN